MMDLLFLKTFCTLGSRSTLLAIGFGSIRSNYWVMISALCIHAMLCVGRQICLFFEYDNFLHLAVATLFMVQAILAFPFGRAPFNSENKSAYALTKLSILSIILINLFAVAYSLMKSPGPREGENACSSTFCFTPDVLIYSSICVILCARLYQYHNGRIDTGSFNLCGCASTSTSSTTTSGVNTGVGAGGAQTRTQGSAQKTD